MDITPVTQLNDAIAAKRAALDGLLADRQRATDAIAAGSQRDNSIADLQAQRDQIVGQAFLANATPDTADIDKAIASAQKKAAATQDAAAAARRAVAILAPQIEQAQAELQALQVQQVEAALDQAKAAYSATFDRIGEVRDALVAALADLCGLASTIHRLDIVLHGQQASPQHTRTAHWIADAHRLLFPDHNGIIGNFASPGSKVAEASRSITAGHVQALRDAGVDFNAGPLQPTPAPVPTKAIEPRPVTITTLGDASSPAGPQVKVLGGDEPAVGLVESVTH